jgi:hypothetical protein
MKPVLRKYRAQKRWQRYRKHIWWLVMIVFGVSGSIAVFLLVPRFQLKEVYVSGNNTIVSEDIIDIAKNILTERIAIFFTRSNIFLFRSNNLEAQILKEFPFIDTAHVTYSFWDEEIRITVSERATWGLYCIMSAPTCYYIATDGVLLAEAPRLTGSIIIRIIDMRSIIDSYAAGNLVISNTRAARIQQVISRLEEHHAIVVQEVMVGRAFADSTELITNEGWYILLDEKTNIARALDDISLVLEKHITDRSDLEYIDIRFEGKVFYRYRNFIEEVNAENNE